jgi:anaerobic selenocysteine-containing dehydrogenase
MAHTFCRLCEVMCGLEVTVTDGVISKVRPDGEHPVSQGFACNKGLLTLDVHHDPDRLDHPMIRGEAGWARASWPEAIDEVAARLRDVIDRHGPEAVAIYIGNPNAFNCLAGPAGALFVMMLGSGRIFSSASVDCSNKFAVSEILYGSSDIHPVADIRRTDHLLVLGSNPRISKSSFISVPDPVAELKGVVARGGSVTFVNPLRIEPGIGPTVQLRPDTDAYLLAAMLHHIDRGVGFRLDGYGDAVTNIDGLRAWLADYHPERVAPVVGVDAATIERLADDFAAAPTASVHCSTGLNMGRQGALGYFLVQMLSLATGNLDRPGGNVTVARATSPLPAASGPGRESMVDTPWEPVRPNKGGLPASLLPAWIRHPEQPVRALICVAGNPALSLGGSAEVEEALRDLDLLVSVDLYRNATAELGHVALPAADWFERPDLNFFTQGVQVVPHVQLTDAVVAPRFERKPEAEIFGLLSEAMGFAPAVPAGMEGISAFFDGDLAGHGLSVAELASRDRGLAVLDESTATPLLAGRRLDCAPELLGDAFERAATIFAELEAEPPGVLRLITRRTRNTLNSAFANIEKLKGRGAATNPLWMHPDDAAARGLVAGDAVRVHNDVGSLEAAVALDADLRPGVVSMTHGFGHAGAAGMPVAQAHPGVNVNVLSPTGPGSFDPISGMAHLTGIPVEVAAAGPTA